MKFKKLTAAVLAAVMAVTAPVAIAQFNQVGIAASAAETLTDGDYSYIVNSDGETATLTKYTGSDANVTIPSALDGKNVTAISSNAFKSCTTLVSVTISDNVKHIGSGAFEGCTSLKSVTIPNSVNIISMFAFSECTSLTNVTIPDSVTRIGENAFSKCTSLANVEIPNSVTYIDMGAFSYCTSLTSIKIPNSLTEIDTAVFGHCTSLASVEIPNSVTEIDMSAFESCTSLTSIEIPYSVRAIGVGAFASCTSLETISAESNAYYSSINGVLFNSDMSQLICYPAGKKDKSYTIPDGVTETYNYSFSGCKNLTNVVLSDSLTKISGSTFNGCTSLVGTIIPNNATTIESGTFRDCSSIISAIIPDGIINIESDAFRRCSGLTSITIPNSVKTIYAYAFDDCEAVETVYYGGTKAEWEAIKIYFNNDCLTKAKIICTDGTINEREPETSEPTSSDTSEPTSSDTSEPTSSDTSDTTSSDTSEPTSSDTSEPTTTDPVPPAITDSNTSGDTSSETSTDTGETTSSDTNSNTSGSSDDFKDENEVSTEVEAPSKPAGVPDDDRITSITINAFNMKNKNGDNVELDLSKISIKASEIYDEEGLKRAEEALGETLKGNKHYNLLDLTLLYDGKDFSNGYEGLVKVIIPLPKGHRDKTFSCYRLTEVNGKMEKQIIPGEQTEDSYIIYLEHFSLYALVADESSTPNISTPDEVNNPYTGGFVTLFAPIAALAAVTVAAVAKKKK